jgi:hypothetical protein
MGKGIWIFLGLSVAYLTYLNRQMFRDTAPISIPMPARIMKDPQDKFPYAGFIGGGPTKGSGPTDDQLMLQQQTAGRFTIIGN